MSCWEVEMLRLKKEAEEEKRRGFIGVPGTMNSVVNDPSINPNVWEKKDNVNNPAHYNHKGIECINAIEASMEPSQFKGYLKGNIIKYLWRYEYKNGTEDLNKARWYLNKLIETWEKSNAE